MPLGELHRSHKNSTAGKPSRACKWRGLFMVLAAPPLTVFLLAAAGCLSGAMTCCALAIEISSGTE